ncbi:MAG: peptidoglycan peptidase [Paracoccus sp. (in: a-proteobacteria)]|nr:peptidoglycan peptidase [Paracoccus sp. (in: a-proteobacteria)]
MRQGRAALLLAGMAVAGAGPDYAALMAEAEWDWRPGDLIFFNDLTPRDALIRRAEGGSWESVGILRASSGDPRVVYAGEQAGVTEAILYEITDSRAPDGYAIWRIRNTAAAAEGVGLMMNYLLLSAYDSPFDDRMLFGNGQFYNAELPFEAALSAGHVIARPQRIGDLVAMDGPLAQAILADWQAHPYCVAALTAGECWQELRDIAIITPGALLSSGALEQVWPRPGPDSASPPANGQ